MKKSANEAEIMLCPLIRAETLTEDHRIGTNHAGPRFEDIVPMSPFVEGRIKQDLDKYD